MPDEIKEINHLVLEAESEQHNYGARRTPQELFKIIKNLLKKDYQRVEQTFYNMDEINTRRLTQESMFQLFSTSVTYPYTVGDVYHPVIYS